MKLWLRIGTCIFVIEIQWQSSGGVTAVNKGESSSAIMYIGIFTFGSVNDGIDSSMETSHKTGSF